MADVLASVALGVAGFFLPGIFKALVTRKRSMTLGAREAKDAFIYESLFDPLSMRRWFDQPKEMRDQEEAAGGDDSSLQLTRKALACRIVKCSYFRLCLHFLHKFLSSSCSLLLLKRS